MFGICSARLAAHCLGARPWLPLLPGPTAPNFSQLRMVHHRATRGGPIPVACSRHPDVDLQMGFHTRDDVALLQGFGEWHTWRERIFKCRSWVVWMSALDAHQTLTICDLHLQLAFHAYFEICEFVKVQERIAENSCQALPYLIG